MSLDEQLLKLPDTKQKKSAERAESLNQARQQARRDQTAQAAEPRTLREAAQTAKRQRAKAALNEENKTATAGTSANRATGKLLRQAWLHLVDSFGLTLIWIDVHVFLGAVFGNKFFCKLGAEWMDDNIVSAQAEKAKSQGKIIGTVEPMGLACCNLGCLFIVIAAFSVVAMMLNVIANPLEAIKHLLPSFWGIITGNK
jgi:hypothetical protein